ncbi:type II secretion system protein GspC [Myxococcus sp. 1LA]
MAPFLRKHFWLVTTTFIALAMLLLPSTTNLLVEFAFTPSLEDTNDAHTSQRRSAPRPHPSLNDVRLAKLTGLSLDPRKQEAPGPSMASLNTSLRVKLLGTLVANDAKWSLASIEDLDAKRIRSVMTGDDLLGARVVTIERERITFSIDGREEFIHAHSAGGVAPAPILANVAPTNAGIRAVGEHSYEVARGTVENALANMDGLLTQARVVPAFRDGKPQGFKVFSVKKGSLYEQLGIQSGDVLRRINGVSLESPERALEAFALLRGSPHLELDIERGGAPVRKVYDVR